MKGMFKGIFIGIKNHPWNFFIYFFASFSVLWTLIRGFSYFILSLDFHGVPYLLTVLLVGAVYSIIKIRQPLRVEIPIHNTNSKIEIKFGNIFDEEGFRVIPVSEFFESDIGIPVSKNSLHGIFLSRCFGGHSESFDHLVQEDLKGSTSEIISKTIGKSRKFPIGTTALLNVNNDRYLCFALTQTELDTCKVSADIPGLWNALKGLWQKSRVVLGGEALILPVVGSGLAGLGLPTKDLLNLIILSIITESKAKQITNILRIIITPDRYEEIDLRKIEQNWR